jgi:hypothetical protein
MKNIRTMIVCVILPIFGFMHPTPAVALRTVDMRADSSSVFAAVFAGGDPSLTIDSTEFKMKTLWRAQLGGYSPSPDMTPSVASIYDLYLNTQTRIGDDYFWIYAGAMPKVKGAVVVSDSRGAGVLPLATQDGSAAAALDNEKILIAAGSRSEDWTSNTLLDAESVVNSTAPAQPVNPVPESATIFLIGAGLIALTSIIRKKAHHRPR